MNPKERDPYELSWKETKGYDFVFELESRGEEVVVKLGLVEDPYWVGDIPEFVLARYLPNCDVAIEGPTTFVVSFPAKLDESYVGACLTLAGLVEVDALFATPAKEEDELEEDEV